MTQNTIEKMGINKTEQKTNQNAEIMLHSSESETIIKERGCNLKTRKKKRKWKASSYMSWEHNNLEEHTKKDKQQMKPEQASEFWGKCNDWREAEKFWQTNSAMEGFLREWEIVCDD